MGRMLADGDGPCLRAYWQPTALRATVFGPDSCPQAHPADAIKEIAENGHPGLGRSDPVGQGPRPTAKTNRKQWGGSRDCVKKTRKNTKAKCRSAASRVAACSNFDSGFPFSRGKYGTAPVKNRQKAVKRGAAWAGESHDYLRLGGMPARGPEPSLPALQD